MGDSWSTAEGNQNVRKIRHEQGLITGPMQWGVMMKKQFFSSSIVSARSRPDELSRVVHSLVRLGNVGQVGEESVEKVIGCRVTSLIKSIESRIDGLGLCL